jgi:DNA-repair protein XRCC3
MQSTTALHLLESMKLHPGLGFGCPILDQAIGRISLGGVTEIAGEAGAGKSNLCLRLSLQAYLSVDKGGLNGSTAYISAGEGQFPMRRLSQMAQNFAKHFQMNVVDVLDKIYIETCMNIEDCLEDIQKKLPKMCMEHNIRLLIIDSLAGLVRSEFDTSKIDQMRLRTQMLFLLAQKLKWLANTFNLAVVVVNQATSAMTEDSLVHSSSSHMVPALGLAWSHCINSRIFLSRDTTFIRSLTSRYVDEADKENENNLINVVDTKQYSKRAMGLTLSPCHPNITAIFQITDGGLVGLGIESTYR